MFCYLWYWLSKTQFLKKLWTNYWNYKYFKKTFDGYQFLRGVQSFDWCNGTPLKPLIVELIQWLIDSLPNSPLKYPCEMRYVPWSNRWFIFAFQSFVGITNRHRKIHNSLSCMPSIWGAGWIFLCKRIIGLPASRFEGITFSRWTRNTTIESSYIPMPEICLDAKRYFQIWTCMEFWENDFFSTLTILRSAMSILVLWLKQGIATLIFLTLIKQPRYESDLATSPQYLNCPLPVTARGFSCV